MARSTARKRALNTLYEADEKGQDILSLLAERIEQPGAQTPLPDYAIEIVRGVAEHIAAIDAMLDEHSTGWKVKRMGVIIAISCASPHGRSCSTMMFPTWWPSMRR